MRIFLDQIGCRLNYSEMETLGRRLAAAGHTLVGAPEGAQVIVFNTCAVTNDAARTSRKQVRHLNSVNPQARIAVTGCWATLARAEAAGLPGVALVAGNEQKGMLDLLLEPWSAELDDLDLLAAIQPDGVPLGLAPQWGFVTQGAPHDHSDGLRARTRAFVKVQDGCDNRCTFCVVTLARGASRSRPVHEIVEEVQALASDGVQEAVLTGVHLGSYGRDLGGSQRRDLKELVAALLSDTDIPRLRLSSLEPWELSPGFFDLWAIWPGRLCPHLHLPLQAGADKQLRMMARRCTTASFRQLVAEARAAVADLIVTTDLIVGFPGETNADFQEGLRFVQEMRFADAHIFPYSARPGTAAASFGEQVPGPIKRARARQMRTLVEGMGAEERRRFIGAVRPVLWEGAGQPLADQSGCLWNGLTDNYLRVKTIVDEDIDLHNMTTKTYLDALDGDGLIGQICAIRSESLPNPGAENTCETKKKPFPDLVSVEQQFARREVRLVSNQKVQ
jgi:threonylcarbamoyladenosine tRNA methylthiotransferase MtaB